MINYKVFLALAISSLAFTSCNKKNEPKPKPKKEVVKEQGKVINNLEVKYAQIDATDYHKWVYFSFKQGAVVNVTNPETDLSWDIAFQRTYVKTNGGTSGKGLAKGMETPFKSFKEMEISYMNTLADDFKADIISFILSDVRQDGNIVKIPTSLNTELNRGITFTPRFNDAPTINLSKKVYFFRDAENKYGAIKFTDYFKEVGKASRLEGGHVSIEYQYPIDPTNK